MIEKFALDRRTLLTGAAAAAGTALALALALAMALAMALAGPAWLPRRSRV
jgi:hypothetical protein